MDWRGKGIIFLSPIKMASGWFRMWLARCDRVAPCQASGPIRCRPEQRKGVPGAYGAELVTGKGIFGIVQGHQNRHLVIDPKTGALFVGVGSSGNLGVERVRRRASYPTTRRKASKL